MEFEITNPGQQPFTADIDIDFNISDEDDPRRAREAKIVVKRSNPIEQFAKVVATEGNDIRFRGYVERYTLEGEKKTLQMKGMENALAYRYAPKFNYCFASQPLHTCLGDTLSGTSTTGVGLLAQAQSLMPPASEYEIIDATNNIIKIAGAGHDSVIGHNDIYQLSKSGVIKYTKSYDIEDLVSNAGYYFQDANDLYVRPPTDSKYTDFYKYPQQGYLLAAYAYDLDIRLHPDVPTDVTLQGGLMEDQQDFLSLIMDLIEANSCEATWIESRGYLYLYYEEVT